MPANTVRAAAVAAALLVAALVAALVVVPLELSLIHI